MASHDTLRIGQVNTPCIDAQRIAVDMSANPKADRLRDARQRAGFSSAAEAAQRFGWAEPAYRHHENGTRNFGLDAAKRYGRAFRVKPGWLLGLENVDASAVADPQGSTHLTVTGSVAAGVWREPGQLDERFRINLPSPIPDADRYGLVVEGHSMDLAYEPGTVLDCVSAFSKDGLRPKTGDHVIVERRRTDGLRELTVKEYREEGGLFLLVPRSTKSEFKPIEYPGPDADGSGDETVQVVGYVLAPYPPRVIELMRRMGLIEP